MSPKVLSMLKKHDHEASQRNAENDGISTVDAKLAGS